MAQILKFDGPPRPRGESVVARRRAVKVTLGPKGPGVVLEQEVRRPTITNDGVSIAREIELEDPYENMGAQLVKEVATKTNDVAGDGTTTATMLAQALVKEGPRNVAAGASPVGLKRGIEAGRRRCRRVHRKQAKEIDDRSEIAQVATISANNDKTIGEVIADAIDKVGKDGVVTVEESNTFGIELAFTEGMQFDKGYLSPYFVSDAGAVPGSGPRRTRPAHRTARSVPSRTSCRAREGHADRQTAADRRRRDIEGEASPPRGQQDPRHVHSGGREGPGFGERRKAMLGDIAAHRRSRSSPRPSGSSWSTTLDLLSSARKIVVITGRPRPSSRVAATRRREQPHQPDQARDRRHRLDWDRESSGAPRQAVQRRRRRPGRRCTEVELRKKHRIEDALSATRAADRGGWSPVAAPPSIPCAGHSSPRHHEAPDGDEATGARWCWPALDARPPDRRQRRPSKERSSSSRSEAEPARWASTPPPAGFEDLIKAGVIDPAKVTRAALQSARRRRGHAPDLRALVADKPEDRAMPAMPGGMGHGGMGR